MKKKRIFNSLVKIALSYYILMLIWMILFSGIFKMNIDYPCSARISNNNCIIHPITEISNNSIEIYLDYYDDGLNGGGCLSESSDSDKIDIIGHSIKIENENVIIDDNLEIKKNGEWEEEKIILSINPWVLLSEKHYFKNYGIIRCSERYKSQNISNYGPTIILIGSTNISYKINYIGISIFIVLVGYWIFLRKRKISK